MTAARPDKGGISRPVAMWLAGIVISGASVAFGGVIHYTTNTVNLANAEAQIEAAKAKVSRMEMAQRDIDARLRAIESDVAAMREIVNVHGVIAFERRMTSLEARVATTEFRLEAAGAPR